MKLILKHISRISGIFVLSFGVLVVSVGLWLWFSLPPISTLKAEYPHLVVVENDGFPRVIFKKLKPLTWVHVFEVSKPAIGAIMVSEDWAFYQHPGYDLNQIQDALEESLKRRHLVRGASTITQQVIKNVFLGPEKTLLRKFKELVAAVALERTLSKRKILEIYLNIAEWGDGIYGISNASLKYFMKHPGELTAKEGAFLAMLLPNPKKYSLSFYRGELSPYAKDTIESILLKMKQAHFLGDEEYQQATKSLLAFEIK